MKLQVAWSKILHQAFGDWDLNHVLERML